jgi:hypothetical protein
VGAVERFHCFQCWTAETVVRRELDHVRSVALIDARGDLAFAPSPSYYRHYAYLRMRENLRGRQLRAQP